MDTYKYLKELLLPSHAIEAGVSSLKVLTISYEEYKEVQLVMINIKSWRLKIALKQLVLGNCLLANKKCICMPNEKKNV